MKPAAGKDNGQGNPGAGDASGKRSAASCPICRTRPMTQSYRPFCSKRCADIDLGRWLKGQYAIAGEPDAEEDENPAANQPADD